MLYQKILATHAMCVCLSGSNSYVTTTAHAYQQTTVSDVYAARSACGCVCFHFVSALHQMEVGTAYNACNCAVSAVPGHSYKTRLLLHWMCCVPESCQRRTFRAVFPRKNPTTQDRTVCAHTFAMCAQQQVCDLSCAVSVDHIEYTQTW